MGGQQALGASLAAGGLAAETELARDDGAAESALSVVVGGLHPGVVGEGPQRGPELEQVAREAAGAPVARGAGGVAAKERLELAAQRADAALEFTAVAGVLVDLPRPEQLRADAQPVLAEFVLGGEAVGVGGEVALQMRPADLAAAQREVRVGPPAIRRDDRLA